MALNSLVVRIGADLSGLDRGLAKADRDVQKFGRTIQPMGRSLTRLGNSASTAAASLSRLGGVMPGLIGGTGALVAGLGSASVVLGETTLLSVGLTKAWRLLGAASTAIAASSAPVWLASLATPAGLAVAAVLALTGAAVGLHAAFRKVEAVDFSKALKILDKADEIAAFRRDLALAAEPTLVLDIKSAAAITTWAPMLTALDRANIAVNQWGDALKGIRPMTADIEKSWTDAMAAIETSLSDVTLSTSEEVRELYRMLAALEDIKRQATALDQLPIFNPPGVGITPGTHTRNDGGEVDYGITDNPNGMFGAIGREVAKAGGDSTGTKIGQVIQAGGGAGHLGQMVQAIAAFGPLGALMPAVNGALEALQPVLTALIAPLVEIGRVVGETLAPIFEMLVPIVQLVADILIRQLAPVLKGITFAISFVLEAFGWLVRGIGRLLDALPGISAKNVINAGQAMIDAAEAARRNARANDNATDAVNSFAGALSNIPRVLNINALRHMVTGTPSGTPPGGTGPIGGNSDRDPLKMVVAGDINIYVEGSGDPERVADAVGRVLERKVSRGGTGRLRLAVT